MSVPASRAAPLLFGSGLCALVYQVAWLRELRLVFGASTAASAAVLAVFMLGLGAGGVVVGKRADRTPDPLAFYGNLELGVAISAAATPLLVIAGRKAYLALGGAAALGLPLATAVRLVLAALVLGGPTFLMGGTLPAAARAVSVPTDGERRNLAMLYGLNTLGAVVGAAAANFVLIEVFGDRFTIWVACLLNALVGMFARSLSRAYPTAAATSPAEPVAAPALPPSLLWLPSLAAGLAGLAFLLMELVWYRMLGPILGGSSYSFGLILCVALAGIGTGGLLYARRGGATATLTAFAWSCGLEALFIAIPYALGDSLAILAIMLRPWGGVGFYGHVAAWTILTGIVVFPAAVVSGYQFPLIVALFGRGEARVARHLGAAYAANTAGAIVGSLAGGFGLMPVLSAPGCWRLAVVLLAASGLGAAALSVIVRGLRPRAPSGPSGRFQQARFGALAPAVAALLAVALLRSPGPTAAWRHSPIGAGRADGLLNGISRNSIKEWVFAQNAHLVWQADGVESSVAVTAAGALSFVVNGKSDGNVREDASTQVMGGLIGAALLPEARRALVIGLGTGSTAGWLAKVPGMERVDVAELEKVILRVARDAATVNLSVLDDPKVHVTVGDAREILLTTRERYDLVFSEPSNPFRAGISSLYTREFYEAAARSLTRDGAFLQWLQLYDIDGPAVRAAIATLSSVFPSVVVFQTQGSDLILVGSARPIRIPVGVLRDRIEAEPLRSAMNATWRAADVEGFVAHHVANEAFARRIVELEGDKINADDDNMLEFAFARQVGKGRSIPHSSLLDASQSLGMDRAEVVVGDVDWNKVQRRRAVEWEAPSAALGARPRPEARGLYEASVRYRAGDLGPALQLWRSRPSSPELADTVQELSMFAEALAGARDEGAVPLAERLRAVRPAEADAILAQLRFREGDVATAAALLLRAFDAYHEDPWPSSAVMDRALGLGVAIAQQDKRMGAPLFESLMTPFAAASLNGARLTTAVRLALVVDPITGEGPRPQLCVRAFAALEPWPPWNRETLAQRAACYRAASDPRATGAERDLDDYTNNAVAPIL